MVTQLEDDDIYNKDDIANTDANDKKKMLPPNSPGKSTL
jgi:hypothetical protein